MSKRTIVFDFDGVIHKYSKGWLDGSIYDSPSPGIYWTIEKLREKGYEVVVVSSRCATPEGISAIDKWLKGYGIVVDRICKEKPPALVYIDDRAICYDPNNINLLNDILNFKPVVKQLEKYENISGLSLQLELEAKQKDFQNRMNMFTEVFKLIEPKISIMIYEEMTNTLNKYIEREIQNK